MLSKKLQEALNKQINREMYNSYLYLSMSAFCQSLNLPGFARWFSIQSAEETGHAMRIYKHVIERLGKIELLEIAKPPKQWKSLLDTFEYAYKAECENTKQIHELCDLAEAESDYPAMNMLDWFITEQVEEEKISHDAIVKLKIAGDSKNGLFILDKIFGARKPE